MRHLITATLIVFILSGCLPPPPGVTSWTDTEGVQRWRNEQRMAAQAEKHRAAQWEMEKRRNLYHRGHWAGPGPRVAVIADNPAAWREALEKHGVSDAGAQFRVGDGAVGVLLIPAEPSSLFVVQIRQTDDAVILRCMPQNIPVNEELKGAWLAARIWTDNKAVHLAGCP